LTRGALGAVVMALVLAGCAPDHASGAGGPCSPPGPGGDPSLLPDDLPVDELVTITDTSEQAGYLGVVGHTDTQIVELYPPLARMLLDAGYRIVAADNEGFEAELYFKRRGINGAIALREGPCPGLVTLRLLYGSQVLPTFSPGPSPT
jgi:hypothetical protein